MAMGLVDTLMVGRVSATDLAAVALGNIVFFVTSVFGMGVLMALDPLVAQAVGAGDREAAARSVQRGLVLAVVLASITSVVLMGAGPALRFARQPDEVVPAAALYVYAIIPGIIPFFVFLVFRQTLQAMARVAPILWIALIGNVLNVLLNWIFIWGNLGVPPLGAFGSAIATSLARWCMTGTLLVLAWPLLRRFLKPLRSEVFSLRPLLRMAAIGVPIGIQFQLEFGAFALIGVLMGWIGTTAIAAHQIAVNLAAFAFMIPVGIAAAGSVRVGQAVGRGDAAAARRAAGAALVLGLSIMLLSGSVFILFPGAMGRLFSVDPAVVALVALLLPIAGVFQIFDGLQAVAAGVLRGVGDTRAPMMANLLGFWVLGVPVSIFLGFGLDLGPTGLWWGLAAGLFAVSILLILRVRIRLGRDLHRLNME